MVADAAQPRLAGVLYLLNIGLGVASLALSGRAGTVVLVLAALTYVAVTIILYEYFRPVNPSISALAAGFSLIGCFLSLVNATGIGSIGVHPLGFFGGYCLLLGFLIVRSKFVPAILGVLLMLGGFGWLTFGWPALSSTLVPYNMAPGILSELLFAVWLVAKGRLRAES